METTEAIRLRCSLKTRLSDRPVPVDAVEAVLRAACLAPSARNTQPWRFVVLRERAAIDAFADAALPEASAVIRRAPILVAACVRPADGVTVGDRAYHLYDVGSAVQNLLLAATDRGLATHLIASFDEAAAKRVLGVPDDVRVIVLTPLAYPDPPDYREAAAERLGQRTRLPFSEVTFDGAWAAPWAASGSSGGSRSGPPT
jgi:nitroreductase